MSRERRKFGVFNFLQLLILFPTLTKCWSLSLFSGDEKSIHLHPSSPIESDPEVLRIKRQAYQVYVGGDVSVTVDKGGQVESGVWGHWTQDRECSRTCGGGVLIEKRQCNGECTGPSVRYVSCNIEPCPQGSKDFRAEQCATHNDDALDGNYYKWLPYAGKNKCELTCKPDNSNFYYKWADKVVDGTKCDHLSEDICVEGICLPLGCDGKLGSALKGDKCGVCGGDGTTCKTVEGFFDERNLSPGYHNIIILPVGATSIKIEEMRSSSNSLAIKNGSDFFYLNGNYQIQVHDKEIEVGGTLFKYEKQRADGSPERLTAKGPLEEELTISLLFQRGSGSKDSAIKYEFSIPLEQDIPYLYKPGEWSSCSVTCGKGVQTRTPYCIDTTNQQRVADELCEEFNATKPEVEKSCETVDCEAEWYEGEWESCSQSCGSNGWQYRVIYCHQVYADGRRITVDDGNCTTVKERPAVKQSCNRFACPEWQAGPWSACSEKCGDAKQYRSVVCRSEKEGEEGKLLPEEQCETEKKNENERDCNLGPCEGLTFFTTDWKLCEKCNDTEEKRNVTCKDRTGRAYPLEKCVNENVTEIPQDTRTCATQPPCVYEWHVSEWSKCSTECGHGHKNRRVQCGIYELGDINVVDESLCQGEKPTIKENCTNEEKCTGTWYSSEWTKCTEKCGGGKQSRVAVCLNYDKKPVPEWCDEVEKPEEEQECNTDPCPTCHDSEFGCCPDNSTIAQGPSFEGCSNCSLSEFGCCADNVTDATGPDGKGCPEYVELEASGEELPTEAPKKEGEECEVVNEKTGEKVKVPCSSVNATADELDALLNVTDTNATIHCSKTEFGCCPDWFTPAEGPNKAGCPEYILGTCNETQYGCCLDEVTLARGPNYEGCGEPTCAGSLYGCCKDRKTIAFGPHYAGCERSSFPCELSTFGCCPDGETAALGPNGTGCGANCLNTKHGCCPDGVAVSKGPNNEGCGCQFAQFGCCPDGKSVAKGAGFFGCPQTCAQGEYGCCPDGKTSARGPNKEGCPCQYTKFGCCPDGETTALGSNNEGCFDCRYAKYGCCPDGISKAIGPDYAGCPITPTPPDVVGGTVSPSRIIGCSLPQDQGQVCGTGYKLAWFYDTTEGRCSQFWFGGCNGNENNFKTKEQCERFCVEPLGQGRCYLPKIEGPQRCNQLVARYWYDYTTRQCAAFWWRGCLGNANNFESWEDCQTKCSGIGPIEATTTTQAPTQPPYPYQDPRLQQRIHPGDYRPDLPSDPRDHSHIGAQPPRRQDESFVPQSAPSHEQAPAVEERATEQVCRLNVDAGPCENYQDMWYFDSFSGKCYSFIYSGCGGNENRYRTKDECQHRCGHLMPDPTAKSHDVCNQLMDAGRCRGRFPSWYYDFARGECQSFDYTGCGGNSNRFHTKEQCESLCLRREPSIPIRIGLAGAGRVDQVPHHPPVQVPQRETSNEKHVCEHPKDTGPCNRFVTKWFYNKADGTCNRFHYGGCEGNPNRFETEQQCKNTCGEYTDTCYLPKVVGPCAGRNKRWFYNQSTKQCTEFEYSGCLGNNNNFKSLEECEGRCGGNGSPQNPIATLNQEDVCMLGKDQGPCKALIRMYWYDAHSNLCREFDYGGCLGNGNKFETIEQCMEECSRESRQQLLQALTLPAAHLIQPLSENTFAGTNQYVFNHVGHENELPEDETVLEDDVGHNEDKYYEDKQDGIRFTDSQSPNSENLQEPEDEVFEEEGAITVVYPISKTSLPELCMLPEDRGPCYGEILRWRYDSEINECGHNANYFTSEEACQRACGKFRNQDVCHMPKHDGDCNLSLSKWHYNAQLGECHLFMWTGCGGNGNRFSSKAECQNLCVTETKADNSKGVCHLERDNGPCNDPVTQWYFDIKEGDCRQFTYGGCRGNGNRFNTKSDCQRQCAPRLQNIKLFDAAEVCNLPFESGSCDGSEKKWFFDSLSGLCRSFTYTGCDGNQNRFESDIECYNLCKTFAYKPTKVESLTRLVLANPGPYIAGSLVEMKCISDGDNSDSFVWFRNEMRLDNEIIDPKRYYFSSNMAELKIIGLNFSDAGDYSCAAGKLGLLSKPISIIIKEAPSIEQCLDKGNPSTCGLILKTGLCSNIRYGKFCCKTCLDSGFNF